MYALAFCPDGKLLLVGGGSGNQFWLPGGGIEHGETPIDALTRELCEEAAATLHAVQRIGMQRVEDSLTPGYEYNMFYWCRTTLVEEFIPQHEVTKRRLVTPEDFLDTLFWGRTDPKGQMLLERALQIEHQYKQSSA